MPENPNPTPDSNPPTANQAQACRSMHEGVEAWEDCCVCEPEPRWQQLQEELESQQERERSSQPRPSESRPAADATSPDEDDR